MLKYVREQLAKEGLFEESVTHDEIDDDMFVEAAHVLDELSDVSTHGTEDKDSVRPISGIQIPVNDDIEIDTIEFCMSDGRITDIPGDASTLQESYYNDLKSFNDFHTEACNSVYQLPRESREAYEERVFAKQNRLYNEYMETIVQEGLFGFGEIKLSSPEIIWHMHLNLGQLRANGNEEYNVNIPILYQTKKGKSTILKKQLDCVKYFDYCKIKNAREAIMEYATSNNIKVPKDGNVWDVITPNAALIPQAQSDKYVMLIRYKVSATGEEIFYEIRASIRPKVNGKMKSADDDLVDSKDVSTDMMKKSSVDISTFTDKKTFTESYVEFHMPSRWGNVYQEAISFSGKEPPEMASSTATVDTGSEPPAPDVNNNQPPTPPVENNAQPNETNINIDLPPEENTDNKQQDDTTVDNNEPNDPPAPENPNANDVSDQIANSVNDELAQNNDVDLLNGVDVDTEPNFDANAINSDLGDGNSTDIDMNNESLEDNNIDTDIDTEISDKDFDKMSLNQLIEQAQEKAKDMTIEQLKAFLMNNTMPDGETVGGDSEDGVQEAFIYTKKNINSSMDELLRKALGILNDDKLELSDLIKNFKKNGKKLNKCLTKACKMDVYDENEKKHISLLNRCLVDLMSMVKADSSESNTQTAKRLIKAFTSQAEAVGQIIEKHKDKTVNG